MPSSAPTTTPALSLPTHTRYGPAYVTAAQGTAPVSVDQLLCTEWLLTNSLGGYAMGTFLGVPTRRYHNLLVAATTPPVGRIGTLHSVVEDLVILPDGGPVAGPAETHSLSSFEFTAPDGGEPVLHPRGFSTLVRCISTPEYVEWVHEVAGMRISKRLTLADGTNACELRYLVERIDAKLSPQSVALRLRPLVAMHDVHSLLRQSQFAPFTTQTLPDGLQIQSGSLSLAIHASSNEQHGVEIKSDARWWNNFYHRSEADRMQDCVRDLYSPGEFIAWCAPPDSEATPLEVTLRVALVSGSGANAPNSNADTRRDRLSRMASFAANVDREDDRRDLAALACAADAFIVRRETGKNANTPIDGTSVIAGYPWFSDWGRDTFISLPGLMLCTGRFDEAKATLETFAWARHRGLIPNVFNDQTGHAEFNTVDGSLWFIHATCEYIERSGDRSVLGASIGEACADVIESYRRGTAGGHTDGQDFRIAMDPNDHLITAGSETTQLTWMDARRDGVTFTPRYGKAVEINALWCSALMRLAILHADTNSTVAANVRDLATAASASFARQFWNTDRACLFDCLVPDGPTFRPVNELRPNQLFAISLPHSPLTQSQQQSVLRVVETHLLTPRGVRTLDPANPAYRPRYEGSLFDRDRAYHQGTAWPFLTGVYAMAVLRADNFSAGARTKAREALRSLIDELDPHSPFGGCPGHLAEVYDAAQPQRPSGCPAQAWSIATLLQAMQMLASSPQK